MGLGGIGMSGIAEVLLNLGYRVSGSDLVATPITRRLASLGAKVYEGHAARHVDGAGAVVVSSAVPGSNPEVLKARRKRIPILPRAEMLAEVARLKKTITVSGSHGKTTTTSMVCMALSGAGADPTMVIGGILRNIRSNARLGLGEYLVAEADESDGSFLKLSPLVAVVTNIDTDHLDYYKTLANLKKAFLTHLQTLPFYGAAVLCSDDAPLAGLFPKLDRRILTYGLKGRPMWRAANLRLSKEGSLFDVYRLGRKAGTQRLRVPGRHNVLNALAALAAGDFLGFDLARLMRGLSRFEGVGRRLERLGEAGGVLFLDDYGHHPTEVATTLEAVSTLWKRKRLIVLFQPHRYTRTRLLHRRFGPAFRAADRVYVMDIYPAGERPLPGVTSRLIVDSLKKAGVDAQPFTRALEVARELKAGDVVLTQGAGDVWKVGEDLRRRLKSRALAWI